MLQPRDARSAGLPNCHLSLRWTSQRNTLRRQPDRGRSRSPRAEQQRDERRRQSYRRSKPGCVSRTAFGSRLGPPACREGPIKDFALRGCAGDRSRPTRRLALAEIAQAADPPIAGKQRFRGDPTWRPTVDAVRRRTFGEREVRDDARFETRVHFRTGITRVVPWLVLSDSSRPQVGGELSLRGSFGVRAAVRLTTRPVARDQCRASSGPAPSARTGSP
jgi:hypothetical protein